MIRPVTCICFLMASASGLYLYQAKHASQVLDRTIEKTVHDTDAIREQTRALRTDWTLLNDPEKLRALAEQYLPTLKPVAPSQFVSMADLDTRLPSPRVIPSEPSPVPIAAATPSGEAPTELTQDDATTDSIPVPPVPPSAPIAVVAAPSAGQGEPSPPRTEHKPPPRPVATAAIVQPPTQKPPQPETRTAEARPAPTRLAEPKPPEPKSAESRPPIARVADLRPAPVQRPVTVAARPTPAPVAPQFSGSLLGMAHDGGGAPPPLPRPVPVNAMSGQWPNGG
jgi:hypothetical protein